MWLLASSSSPLHSCPSNKLLEKLHCIMHYLPMQVPFHLAASLVSLSDQHLPWDLFSDWCRFISGWSRTHDHQFDRYPDRIDQWDLLRSTHYAYAYGELKNPSIPAKADYFKCNLNYPDPFRPQADPGIPDKWNSPDKWNAYLFCLIYDTYPLNNAYRACSWSAAFIKVHWSVSFGQDKSVELSRSSLNYCHTPKTSFATRSVHAYYVGLNQVQTTEVPDKRGCTVLL